MPVTTAKVLSGLMGLCVGDALGLPAEFTSREERTKSPIADMTGYGTWNQPPGTWSDDSSLAFCVAECLCGDFSIQAVANSFLRWRAKGYWTPHGHVFDIGATTAIALYRLQQGISPQESGECAEGTNGNDSLSRSLPFAFFYETARLPELIERVHQTSAITHAHPRARMACGIYVNIAMFLLEGHDPHDAYQLGAQQAKSLYNRSPYSLELIHFDRILSQSMHNVPQTKIYSGGYVVNTLEAALWCFLTTNSYKEAVLKAVNLGGSTDATAAVTGSLAGIYYGTTGIPAEWMNQVARQDDVADLAHRLAAKLSW